MTRLVSLAPGLHTATTAQRFFGLEVGARMTIMESGEQLLVHSPIGVDPRVVDGLGETKWLVAPNLLHHLYVAPFCREGVALWGPRGLPGKRPDLHFAGVITDWGTPFGPDIEAYPLSCIPLTNEVVLLHKPSRTLVVTDLVFHFTDAAPATTRVVMRGMGGYPGCRTSLLEKVVIKRDTARQELSALLVLDFDRLMMAHGDIIETGGKAALARAFSWLGQLPNPVDEGAGAAGQSVIGEPSKSGA